jgi:arylsulfatase A-like enzyme
MRVVVIVARGLQAGALGCYGNRLAQTPALDGLAASGALFDWHFADRADAEGARRAWRSGCHDFPFPEDAPRPAGFQPPDLLPRLREAGAHLHLLVDGSRPAPASFEVGWSVVQRVEGLEATVEAVAAGLDELAERDQWLLWVDLGTASPPWDVPEEFLETAPAPEEDEEETDEEEEDEEDERGEEEGDEENERGEEEEEEAPVVPVLSPSAGPIDPKDDALYLGIQAGQAAVVAYLDAGVGAILEAIEEANGEVAVLFLSDHGLPLGEHGVVGAVRPWLHDEVIHLPLLLRLPGLAEPGLRLPALTQSVDLAPTLAELFGVSLVGAHGHSLLPLLHGKAEVRPYACAGAQVSGGIEWALRTPDWALLLPLQTGPDQPPRGPQLYVKPDDRWEVNNVLQHHPELGEILEQTLRGFVEATSRPGILLPPPLRDVEIEHAAPEHSQPGPPSKGEVSP